MAGSISIGGLDEFRAAVATLDAGTRDALRAAAEEAADLVAAETRRKMPSRSGAARGSVRTADGEVTLGDRRAPYAQWLDYGGRVGPKQSVVRPYKPKGRYLYPTLLHREQQIEEALEAALEALVQKSGLR